MILEASSASAGKTAKNVVVKVEQQPTLKTIRADMRTVLSCGWMKMRFLQISLPLPATISMAEK